MRASSQLMPTRREVILLACLLLGLFCFVPTNYGTLQFSKLDNLSYDTESSSSTTGIYPEPRLTWEESLIPETGMLHHSPGWTIFDRLYIFNGTIYVVSSNPELLPERKLISSSGYEIFNEPEDILRRLPSDKDIQIITPEDAQKIFKTHSASRLTGVSFLVTDPKQFIAHYYHFAAELFFGLWRTYTALDPFITHDGYTTLPPPRRLMFRHVSSSSWRDYAAMNQWVLRGALPSIGMEFSEDWADRAAMQVPFVLDRVVLGDRAASCESDAFKATWRSASSAFELRGSPDWWTPVRKSVLEFSGLTVGRNDGSSPSERAENEKYVITYISRQKWGRRMLLPEDHENLVSELYKLRDRYGYEVNVVDMDKLSRAEQLQLAGRTTIMMGLHGNGLTSLLWMKPTPRATVIEFFYPGGFAFDYEYTTRALGMMHYGVWNNKTFTQPDVPHQPSYPEGFQGNEIPLDGKVVADLVHKRLTVTTEESDSSPSM